MANEAVTENAFQVRGPDTWLAVVAPEDTIVCRPPGLPLRAYPAATFGLLTTGDAPITAVKSEDEPRRSTDLGDDAELVILLAAHRTYRYEAVAFYESASNVPDIRFSIGGPADADWVIYQLSQFDTVGGVLVAHEAAVKTAFNEILGYDSEAHDHPVGLHGVGVAKVKGTIRTGPSAGNLAFRWAQRNASGQALIVKRGSYLELQEAVAGPEGS